MFQLLGPLRITENGRVASINARKVATLLAVFLIRANEVVSTEQLVAELWGYSPPRRAVAGLHVYVSQLRKFLAANGRDCADLVTRSPGYLMRIGPDELDLPEFLRLFDEGRGAFRAGDYEVASTALTHGLDLWRGRILEDQRGGEIVDGFVAWLDELRLECCEKLVECDFRLGRHRELVGFLRNLVAEYPLHEVFYRQLMLALHRSGRRAAALQVYQHARHTIVAELGLEPSRAVRELHQAILVDD